MLNAQNVYYVVWYYIFMSILWLHYSKMNLLAGQHCASGFCEHIHSS